jgi:hypothetical protein
MLFDGEGFILQVQRVFTRIRSGLRYWLLADVHVDLRFSAWWQRALEAAS